MISPPAFRRAEISLHPSDDMRPSPFQNMVAMTAILVKCVNRSPILRLGAIISLQAPLRFVLTRKADGPGQRGLI